MSRLRALRSTVSALLLAGSLACGPSVEEQAGTLQVPLTFPSRTDFLEVGPALQLRCGTLDCHGQVGRNLRLYGYGGLRFSTPEHPIVDSAADPTTEAEVAESYLATVFLEPDELSRVASSRAEPNTLALVRKARGEESHKGGQLMRPLDSLDLCLTRWLTHHHDAAACLAVVEAPRPGEQ